MKDQADKQTQPLPLEQPKRGRGRPATGAAMTPAEKQKAYRERQKKASKQAGECPVMLREALESLAERQLSLEKELGEWAKRARKAEKELEEIKSNVTQNSRIGKSGRDLINSVFEVAEATEGSCWQIQRKSKVNGEWKTLQGSYWNQAKAEDALIDMPQKKGSWWRVIEVKSEVED